MLSIPIHLFWITCSAMYQSEWKIDSKISWNVAVYTSPCTTWGIRYSYKVTPMLSWKSSRLWMRPNYRVPPGRWSVTHTVKFFDKNFPVSNHHICPIKPIELCAFFPCSLSFHDCMIIFFSDPPCSFDIPIPLQDIFRCRMHGTWYIYRLHYTHETV